MTSSRKKPASLPASLPDGWIKAKGLLASLRRRLPGKKPAPRLDGKRPQEDGDDSARKPLCTKVLKGILTALVVVVGAAVFYLAMILGQPIGDPVAALEAQPLLPAAPAIHLTDAAQLPMLVRQSPIPVLGFMTGAGVTLTAGSAYDTAFEQGFARIVSLTYATPEGMEIQVQSIYPARALSLLPRSGFSLSSAPLYAFSGLHGVRMDSATQTRIHAQNAQGVYVVTLPREHGDLILEIGRGIRMYVPAEQE